MPTTIFTSDFKPNPYWWDDTPLSESAESANPALPDTADVVIVGSGYTGLHAALQTARAGMSTVVLEANAIGSGCSTRNGGQISTSIKFSHQTLSKRYGKEIANDILAMGKSSLDYVGNFVKSENIECSYKAAGRFHGAHTARQFQKLAESINSVNPVFDDEAFLVSRDEQHTELGTDRYHGGVVFPHYAGIDPAKYHVGCLQRVREAGATVLGHSAVTDIKRQEKGYQIETRVGKIHAQEVVIATNGYTTNITPHLQRRVIPIGSYIIATEVIEPAVMDTLFPTDRMLTDSRKLVYYYRPSPDRKRILFGGRVSLSETDPLKSGAKLHAELVRLFPPLKHVKVSHSWVGTVAYTFDTMMHSGVQDGMHYAMGYCGSGVGMAGYLGSCIGKTLAGTTDTAIPVSRINFPTRPLYNGTPWFLAPAVGIYRLRDRMKW